MANIFAAITAVLLAASAYLAFKNQQAYEKEIEDSEFARENLEKSRKRLADLRSERDATIDERTGVEEETVAKQAIEAEREAGKKALQDEIGTKKTEVEDNARRISEIDDQTKELGEVRDLADKVRQMRTEIQGLEDEKATNDARLANLLASKRSTESTIDDYQGETDAFSKQRSFVNRARIGGIRGTWGIVRLNAGKCAGVVTNSTLDVVRGGEVIAKLRVRSVESSRASADIVPDSVAEDTVLMVGDRVVPAPVDEAPEPAAPEQPAVDEMDQPAAEPAEEPAAPPAEEPAPAEEEDDFDFDL